MDRMRPLKKLSHTKSILLSVCLLGSVPSSATEPRKNISVCPGYSLTRPVSENVGEIIPANQPWQSEAQLKTKSCEDLRAYTQTLRSFASTMLETEMAQVRRTRAALDRQSTQTRARLSNGEALSREELRALQNLFHQAAEAFNTAVYGQANPEDTEHLFVEIKNRVRNALQEIDRTHNCVLAVARLDPTCTWHASREHGAFSAYIESLTSDQSFLQERRRVEALQQSAAPVSERLQQEIRAHGAGPGTAPNRSARPAR